MSARLEGKGMTVRAEAAVAARRVAAARRRLTDPPPLDCGAWATLLVRLDELSRAADRDSALAAVEAWEAGAMRSCGLEVAEGCSGPCAEGPTRDSDPEAGDER